MAGARIRSAAMALLVLVPLALGGCSSEEPLHVAVALDEPIVAPTLEITPASGSTDLPASTEIGTTFANGTISDAALVDAAGTSVTGSMRSDNSGWIPDRTLDYGQTYTATITVSGDGGAISKTTTFTTMAKPSSSKQANTTLYMTTDRTYGVAMPVVITFASAVPTESRAEVVKRLFVTSQPAQNGAWRWYGSDTVVYRPETYWQAGTTITVRSALGGLPIGSLYGATDKTATVTIGRDLRISVDNATKEMTVTQDGVVVKTIDVSLGKSSTPSSSGTMVIMEKLSHTTFDTTEELGSEGYVTEVDYAQRLTWGGEFIHAAPWSVGSQGNTNVSHGCINVSTANAKWLFDTTLVGDPVTTAGTGRQLVSGNGWTVWNMTWEEYIS